MHVGMTVEEFYQAFDRREIKLVDLDGEGMFSPALVVRANGRVLVTGEIDKKNGDWIIFRIAINDRRYHTVAGLGVGSTLADLKRALPGAENPHGRGPAIRVCRGGIPLIWPGCGYRKGASRPVDGQVHSDAPLIFFRPP